MAVQQGGVRFEALKTALFRADHGDLAQTSLVTHAGMPACLICSPNPSDDACRAHRLIGRGELPELSRFRFHLQHPLLRALANHRRTTFRRLGLHGVRVCEQ